MTDEPSAETTDASFADPEALRDREGVEFREKPCIDHQSHFETYEPVEGMAVVGVVDDAGAALLAYNDSIPAWVLLHGTVEAGEDWAAVARRAVAGQTGLAVEIDRPVRVRRKQYRTEDDGDRRTTGYDVVFRASPVAGETISDAPEFTGENWSVDWFDAVPDGLDAGNDDVADDVRLFVG